MFCDQCGAQQEAGARFCSRCGKPGLAAPVIGAPRQGRVQSHIRLLGIFWLAVSAFDAVSGLLALIIFSIVSHHGDLQGLPIFVQHLIKAVFVFLVLKAAGGFFTGWGLLNRQPWARTLAIVLGVISLFFHFPFGTALGVYTLWVLLPAHSEAEYEKYQATAA
jgi:hypothetical protein